MEKLTQQAWADEADEVARSGGLLDPRVRARLGRELRAIYEEVVSDPLPDDIQDALNRLEQSTKKQVRS